MNSQAHEEARAVLRAARATDAKGVRALLTAASLPVVGVPDHLEHFIVAERNGAVVGAIGLEVYGDNAAALLRSAVVDPTLRGSGVGEALVHALLAHAQSLGVRDVVLLTTTAAEWFPRFGFSRITRDDVPAALHASEELRGACPASAVVMRCTLTA